MAIREEELLVREAVIYRFPTEEIARRRALETAVRRRRAAASLITVAISVGLLATWTPGPDAAAGAAPNRIVVAPGETLWDIAEAHAPASIDPRAYVDRVQELNALSGPIRPGMRLKLPR